MVQCTADMNWLGKELNLGGVLGMGVGKGNKGIRELNKVVKSVGIC